ncbi:hypothetical protein LCGC14_0380340 [marine sediment metagenome]|uniref:Uncharacterized protein n=1 Tax=marine sediment metagenome TaxID=412755 RepID=A0A0F9WB86_9ZZZZ
MTLGTDNDLQFVTLDSVKSHFGITDKQDDNTLLSIVQAANLEVKKQVLTVTDDVNTIEGTPLFKPGQNAALVFVEAEIRRLINKLYEEANKIMLRFDAMMETYLGEFRSQAPTRTSKKLSARDTDFEDDHFAERHFV